MTLQATRTITLVNPVAPAPTDDRVRQRPAITRLQGLRLGLLDNGKANADHLLQMLSADLQRDLGTTLAVQGRKPHPSIAAAREQLAELARDADFVVSAMAD